MHTSKFPLTRIGDWALCIVNPADLQNADAAEFFLTSLVHWAQESCPAWDDWGQHIISLGMAATSYRPHRPESCIYDYE